MRRRFLLLCTCWNVNFPRYAEFHRVLESVAVTFPLSLPGGEGRLSVRCRHGITFFLAVSLFCHWPGHRHWLFVFLPLIHPGQYWPALKIDQVESVPAKWERMFVRVLIEWFFEGQTISYSLVVMNILAWVIISVTSSPGRFPVSLFYSFCLKINNYSIVNYPITAVEGERVRDWNEKMIGVTVQMIYKTSYVSIIASMEQ